MYLVGTWGVVGNRHYTLHCQRAIAPLGISSPWPQSAFRHPTNFSKEKAVNFKTQWMCTISSGLTLKYTRPRTLIPRTTQQIWQCTAPSLKRAGSWEELWIQGRGKTTRRETMRDILHLSYLLTFCLTKNIVIKTSPNSGLFLVFSQSNFECRSYNKQSESTKKQKYWNAYKKNVFRVDCVVTFSFDCVVTFSTFSPFHLIYWFESILP